MICCQKCFEENDSCPRADTTWVHAAQSSQEDVPDWHCRNLQVCRYYPKPTPHYLPQHYHLLQETKSFLEMARSGRVSRKSPAPPPPPPLPARSAPQQPPESAALEPLGAVQLKTGWTGTGTSWQFGRGSSKQLKLSLPHLRWQEGKLFVQD